MQKIWGTLFLLLLLSSCSTLTANKSVPSKCFVDGGNQVYQERINLFEPLSKKEIQRREKISLFWYPTNSGKNDENILNKIITAYNQASEGQDLIAVDLRGYKRVVFGNLILSNFEQEKLLDEDFLNTETVFEQKTFILFNVNDHGSKIMIGDLILPNLPLDKLIKLDNRPDLANSELVINVSQIADKNGEIKPSILTGNVKFSGSKTRRKEISIIAENIKHDLETHNKTGISMDIRQVSNKNLTLDQQEHWQMPLYSTRNSDLIHGKDTTGIIDYFHNENVGLNQVEKFDVKVNCYYDYSKRIIAKEMSF